jgi:hypothetical protein
VDAFQADAFQATAFQAQGSSVGAHAFQCGAFQSSAFQTCGGASGYQPAFQCGAFQFNAYQTCKPKPSQQITGGGFVKHPHKNPRFSPIELSPLQLRDERVRFGVIPAPVKKIVKRVAKRALDDLDRTERDISAELRTELARIDIQYSQAYAQALAIERERLVTQEIKQLLARQAQQQESERLMMIAEHLAELKRQIDAFRREDEQAIELLLLYS